MRVANLGDLEWKRGNAGAAEALAGKGNRFVIEDIDYAKVATLVAQSWA